MTNEQRAFFKDLARSLDGAVDDVRDALAGAVPDGSEDLAAEFAVLAGQLDDLGRSAVVSIVRDAVTTALHSAMVAIDGGSSSAETVVLELVKADDGEPLAPSGGYHELFVEHLFETGREQ